MGGYAAWLLVVFILGAVAIYLNFVSFTTRMTGARI